jgi:catechol 2,3-dioxygenase-like lactoylglutathione lyase family enzyme
MFLNLDHIGQIALAVGDVDRAEAFYRDVLKLRKLTFDFSPATPLRGHGV